MNTETYNGWTNYETWLVKLWIDNDQGEQEYWLERATNASKAAISHDQTDYLSHEQMARYRLADELKNSMTDQAGDLAGITGLFSDLLGAALSAVNWFEIAQSLLDDSSELAA